MNAAIAANKRMTVLLMFGFVLLMAGIAALAAYLQNSVAVGVSLLVVAGIYVAIQYFAADKLALTVNGAREVAKIECPEYFRAVENIAITMGLPMPRLYVMEDEARNAFATGRDPQHASVAVTTGLLKALDKTELEAVVAHELSHIQNYDIRVMMIVFGLVSAVALIGDMFRRTLWTSGRRVGRSVHPVLLLMAVLLSIIAPLLAVVIQMAISRQREYLADASAAYATRYPDGLARALQKIAEGGSAMQRQHTATAHLFLANPVTESWFDKLFSTHPPIEERIQRLGAMGSTL